MTPNNDERHFAPPDALRSHLDEFRLKGEKRDASFRRILLGKVLRGEAVESDETETA